MATPRDAISSSSRETWSTIFGASPSVGSSIMIMSGSPMSVRHMLNICCSPPLSTPPATSARSARLGNISKISDIVQRELRWPFFIPSIRFCLTVRVGKISLFSGTYPSPRLAISKLGLPAISSPLNFIEPTGLTSPIIDFTVVERPTPLRPRRLTISPSCTLNSTP